MSFTHLLGIMEVYVLKLCVRLCSHFGVRAQDLALCRMPQVPLEGEGNPGAKAGDRIIEEQTPVHMLLDHLRVQDPSFGGAAGGVGPEDIWSKHRLDCRRLRLFQF